MVQSFPDLKFNFDELKYLVTIVSEDLLKDDFGNLEMGSPVRSGDGLSSISEEIYDKLNVLRLLIDELYKYRPLPF